MENTVWFSCGVLRAEITELHRQGKINGKIFFMDSMLHMDPPKLEEVLASFLEKSEGTRARIVIVYGDCCARMVDLVKNYDVCRVDSINCAQLLLGKERYRELMRSESFILLPEWALRWKEIISVELGLDAETAKEFFGENRNELVYLDTGLTPVPEEYLIDMSAYTGLPWRTLAVDLSRLLEQMKAAENRMTSRGSDE